MEIRRSYDRLNSTMGFHILVRWHLYIESGPRLPSGNKQIGIGPACHLVCILTHWGRDKMATVSQTTLSNAFSCMKILEFRLIFHRKLFLRVQLTIFQHWFRWWLGAGQATSHYLNQWWLLNWCIYASLGPNELMYYIGIKVVQIENDVCKT